MKKSCGLFTNIAPLYSRALWYELSRSQVIDYTFYSSKKGFSGIRTIDINESRWINRKGELNWLFLKNLFFKNILFFQTGIISKCLLSDYDAYILYGEMHSISNWFAAIICKLRHKPVLMWGHGLYGDEKNIKKIIRVCYYKLVDCHLVYANRSRDLMIKSGFKPENVFTVYNSLDHNTHKMIYEKKNVHELISLKKRLFTKNSHLPVIIFIGRLTKEKKLVYLLEAISYSRKKGNIYNCLIVGEGEQFHDLEALAHSQEITDQICFYGPSYDECINSKFIMLSDCCVSPGNVGLTAIHSLSLGTPVITHENFTNQGPEAEAILNNETGCFFRENDSAHLSEVIDDFMVKNKKSYMEKKCIDQVEKYWNPFNQASIFERAILNSIK
jgi:glycosyltransferase involved in cell wall biosynthesis